MTDCRWVQYCMFLEKLVLNLKKKQWWSQNDITTSPIVPHFAQCPISLPALPFTQRALYHSHTWKSVTPSPNTTSLLFPLALWRQQGSPLLALIYNAVKLIQTRVFMRALISIMCVFTAEERMTKVKRNCDCILTPKRRRHPSTIAAIKSKVCQSQEMLRNDKRNKLYWKSKRASQPLMSHSCCVAMAPWRWTIITVHPQRERTRRRDMSSVCSYRVHDPRERHQVGAEDGGPGEQSENCCETTWGGGCLCKKNKKLNM